MYEDYFGLKKKPFSIVPDPAYFYLSDGHREALAHLLYGTTSDGGFVLLTGEVGTGKTTVCRRLLELTPEETEVAFILNPKVTSEELLATICDEFGVSYPEGTTSIKVLVARINDYLLNVHDRGRRAVLIVEEAQNLKAEVLEQIRLLTNLETNQRKLLQMIMIGQPELREMLAKPQLRQLSQRITARYHLDALSKEEIPGYINYRLSVAGAVRGPLFPPATVKRVYGLTKGIPRLINVICDRALLGAFVQEKERVDIKILKKAAREVLAEENHGGIRRRLAYGAAGVLLFVVVALGSLLYVPGAGRWLPESLHAYVPHRPVVATKAEPPEVVVTARYEGSIAAARTENVQRGALGRPAGRSGGDTREMAYGALFRKWQIPYKRGSRDTMCGQAESHGLRCLAGKGSITNLREMDRPAMLRLVDETNREYYAVVTALKGEVATFSIGDETRTVDKTEIARYWSGDYLLLWRVPPGYRGGLKPGSRGSMVAWLERQLALVQGRVAPAGGGGMYDEKVMKQVREFQIAAGMVPDGIAGPRTIMRLGAAGPDKGDPVLEGRKGIK
ncbi:MAG: AAA family ATPase [Syntrophorhabdales bacterium]|jgi:general secretion pathway protein A